MINKIELIAYLHIILTSTFTLSECIIFYLPILILNLLQLVISTYFNLLLVILKFKRNRAILIGWHVRG